MGYWTTKPGATSIITESGRTISKVQNLNIGANTFQWTEQRNGCWASKEIVVYNNLTVAQAGNDAVVCENKVYLDAGKSDYEPWNNNYGQWTLVDGQGEFEFANQNNVLRSKIV